MKGRIKRGSAIFQDSWFGNWPYLKASKDNPNVDPNMIFDMEWKETYWDCSAPGYGDKTGHYGNGSIFVRAKEGIIPVLEDSLEYALSKHTDSTDPIKCFTMGWNAAKANSLIEIARYKEICAEQKNIIEGFKGECKELGTTDICVTLSRKDERISTLVGNIGKALEILEKDI